MELISWIATSFVLISFLFEGRTLRILNGIGAGLWLWWGLDAGENSIIFLNGVVVAIQVYKLSIEKKIKSFTTELKKTTWKNFFKNRHGA